MDQRDLLTAPLLIVGGIFAIGFVFVVARTLYRELRYGPPPPPSATPRIQLDDPPKPIIPKSQYHALNLPLSELPEPPRMHSPRRPASADEASPREPDDSESEE